MEYYRAQLGAFGLSGDIALRPVASLSGGQKSRVAFTLMTMHKLVVLHSNCVSGYGSLPGDNSNNNDDNRWDFLQLIAWTDIRFIANFWHMVEIF